MKSSWPSLLPILRSDAQGRILAAVMVNPEAEHSITDLAERAHTSEPTVTREVNRAEQSAILSTRRLGKTRLVRANTRHVLYLPLSQIVLATYGPPAIVAQALAGVDDIDEIYLFGSWAARYQGTPGRWPNDIDVLVVGHPDRDQAYDAAEEAEREIGLPVQLTIRTPVQWDDEADDSFVAEVRSRPLVSLSTTSHDEVGR